MVERLTIPAKHIYLDVVEFTRDRSVEAQVEIVRSLNEIVSAALDAAALDPNDVILLPTGDGMCIVLLATFDPFDIHIAICLDILARLAEHNAQIDDPARRFSLRIGINENVDNLVVDINGRRNIAGAGINMAQRIMTLADANQVFVSTTVFETLSQRERYMSTFRQFSTSIKHGIRLTGYQYVEPGRKGLDVNTPSSFKPSSPAVRELNPTLSHYLGLAATHREAIIQADTQYATIVLLWFLAQDAVSRAQTPSYRESIVKAPPGDSFAKQLAAIDESPFYVRADLAQWIQASQLEPFYECFDRDTYNMRDYRFVTSTGIQRLISEQPAIAKEYSLSQ